MAACFICGLWLGTLAVRGGKAPARLSASLPGGEGSVATAADKEGFWSARRIRAGWAPSTTKTESQFIWKSPLKKPEVF
jgi:hypothetical protein